MLLRVRPGADQALIHRLPATGEQGRFSAEYLVALGLLGRGLDLATLGPGPADPDAVALAARVVREHLPGATPPGAPGVRDRWSEVVVEWRDGGADRAVVEIPEGAPRRPLGESARAAKRAAAAGGRADELRAVVAEAAGLPWARTVARLRGFTP